MKQNRMSERDKDFSDYYEYHEIHYPQILQMLRQVDRVRSKLITAQNDLVMLLRGINNEYSERQFLEFYAAGGITADDWKAKYEAEKDSYQEPKSVTSWGQLRVVSNGEQARG